MPSVKPRFVALLLPTTTVTLLWSMTSVEAYSGTASTEFPLPAVAGRPSPDATSGNAIREVSVEADRVMPVTRPASARCATTEHELTQVGNGGEQSRRRIALIALVASEPLRARWELSGLEIPGKQRSVLHVAGSQRRVLDVLTGQRRVLDVLAGDGERGVGAAAEGDETATVAITLA
jgi:hypothetical protein